VTVVARFEIPHRGVLAPDGTVCGERPGFARDRATLVALYRWRVLTRSFDAKAVALQRTGRLGTYASSLGQEAVAVGLAHAMRSDDVLVPSFREHGAPLMRGVTMTGLFLDWGGDERGSDFAGPRHDFPVSSSSRPSRTAWPTPRRPTTRAATAMTPRWRGTGRTSPSRACVRT
jgi:pyruvate dehydrogenase E1 component alpha subunit